MLSSDQLAQGPNGSWKNMAGHIKAGMTQGMAIRGIYILCSSSPIPSCDPCTSK